LDNLINDLYIQDVTVQQLQKEELRIKQSLDQLNRQRENQLVEFQDAI